MRHGTNAGYTVDGCRCDKCTAAHTEAARDLKQRRETMFHDAVASEFNTIRGRVLGLIESWGLPETQERGAKSTFKALTYDAEKSIKELWK